ncbi:DUF6642 family protein [Gordonia phosphorivorans]|uniref:DUF6642 family protein n=1 Tax=Gordonia phosphorivorans TaxID=1056982 RepID=A0ABV6H8N7_9ACTN
MSDQSEQPTGLFCLEGEWSDSLTDAKSVRPLLDLLASTGSARYIHRRIATSTEFFHQLDKWLEGGCEGDLDDYLTLMIAAHGLVGEVEFDDRSVSLEDLGKHFDGRAGDCFVYFGSCATLSAPDSELLRFRARTGARAVFGYTHDVDWLTSAAFEALLIHEMTNSANGAQVFSRLHARYGSMVEELGLTVVTSSGVRRAHA